MISSESPCGRPAAVVRVRFGAVLWDESRAAQEAAQLSHWRQFEPACIGLLVLALMSVFGETEPILPG